MIQMTVQSPKILVVDDHQLFIDGLKQILKLLNHDSTIYSANNAHDALNILDNHPEMDWVFLDLNMPQINGIQLLGKFRERMLSAPVIIVSEAEDPAKLDQAINLGVSGFIPKSVGADVFKKAMERVYMGKNYIHQDHAELLLGYKARRQNEIDKVKEFLTPRLMEVLTLMNNGFSNQKIADSLGISESTVKTHVSTLLSAFEAENRTHCTTKARSLGFCE